MLYHSPDNRWPIFGCPDYESYLEKYLVKGLFHAGVPEDVKKDFETIEHLMAHAWYHYPMYDEAMNKLLRTVELAVKIKCELLSIPITYKNKKGETRKEDLVGLIRSVHEKEPSKKLKIFLDHLRNLRNMFMHPDRSSYVGGMLYNKIVLTINILNILFADEQTILELEAKREQMRKKLQRFSQIVLGFQRGDEGILAHNLTFGDVFVNSEKEVLLIDIDPVGRFEPGTKPQNQWIRPIFVELVDYKITSDKISGIEVDSGKPVSVFLHSHPHDVKKVEEFRSQIYKITLQGSDLDFPEAQDNPHITFTREEKAREMQKFRYRHYHKLSVHTTQA
jgi:hypothetical protein